MSIEVKALTDGNVQVELKEKGNGGEWTIVVWKDDPSTPSEPPTGAHTYDGKNPTFKVTLEVSNLKGTGNRVRAKATNDGDQGQYSYHSLIVPINFGPGGTGGPPTT